MKILRPLLMLLFISVLLAGCQPRVSSEDVKESLSGVMFVLYFTSFAAELGQPLDGVSIAIEEEGAAWEISMANYPVAEIYALRSEYFPVELQQAPFSTISGVYRIIPESQDLQGEVFIKSGSVDKITFHYDSTHFLQLLIDGKDWMDEANQWIDSEGFLQQ